MISSSKKLLVEVVLEKFGLLKKKKRVSNSRLKKCLKQRCLNSIIKKNSVQSVMLENEILRKMKHSLILQMKYSFQDRDYLYLLMQQLRGGDLRFHLIHKRTFTESETKFFICCAISALDYVHQKKIIHRDIKPENFVFDEEGYLYLTDFGIAKYYRPDNHKDTSGTPGYMAPEILARKSYSYSVDFYALGIILHECIMGKRPYSGRNRKEIRQQVFAKQAKIKSDLITDWSREAIHFCNSLIQRKREKRLGENGIIELKNHVWLKDVDWEAISQKRIKPVFEIPPQDIFYDKNHVQKPDEPVSKEELALLKRKEIQQLFKGYEYCQQIVLMPKMSSNYDISTCSSTNPNQQKLSIQNNKCKQITN